MIAQLSVKASLFLFVRTHSQLAYYLNLADSSRAANDGSSAGGGADPKVVDLSSARKQRM